MTYFEKDENPFEFRRGSDMLLNEQKGKNGKM